MKNTEWRAFIFLLRRASQVAALTILAGSFALSDTAAQRRANWLTNPGFEDEGRWLFQDGIREVMVPPGWFAFWRPGPPEELPLPSNCPDRSDVGCYWARPEFREVKAAEFPNRVRSGARAVRYFTWGRMHEAGLYQIVEGLPPGAEIEFSTWLQAWMCADASACQGGAVSDAPAHMHLQVGIDPWGGLDPWSPDVIWSPEGEAFDHWRLFQVSAVSETGLATVFIRSRATWDWARSNNDVYVDDARLRVLPQPTPDAAQRPLPGLARVSTSPPSSSATVQPESRSSAAVTRSFRPTASPGSLTATPDDDSWQALGQCLPWSWGGLLFLAGVLTWWGIRTARRRNG